MADPPTTSSPAADAALALLRALVEEVKSVAHDPAMVHAIAERLKHGIDAVAESIAPDPTKPKIK